MDNEMTGAVGMSTLRLTLTRRDEYCLRCDGLALRTSDYCRSCRDAIERGDVEEDDWHYRYKLDLGAGQGW